MAGNSAISCHIFHDYAYEIGTGNDFKVHSQADILKIEFNISESGNFSANVKVKMEYDSPWREHPIVQMSPTFPILTTVTDPNYLYELDLRGISEIRIELASLTGYITIRARAVG